MLSDAFDNIAASAEGDAAAPDEPKPAAPA
jgi:hypothetical protein